MNKSSSPHMKSHCLRNYSVLLETILAGWEDETDYLIEIFQLSQFFYPLGTMLWTGQLQKFNGISPVYIKAKSGSVTRKQFVVHEQYLLPLKPSQDIMMSSKQGLKRQWKVHKRIGINGRIEMFQNWSQNIYFSYCPYWSKTYLGINDKFALLETSWLAYARKSTINSSNI